MSDPLPLCTLHSITVQTSDFDRAFNFYTEILGLSVIRKPFRFKGKRTLAWIDAGSCQIELFSVKDGEEPTQWSSRGLGPVNLAFEVDDLDAMLSRLRSAGVTVLREPFVPPSGDPNQPKLFFVQGFDGEEIVLRARKKNS